MEIVDNRVLLLRTRDTSKYRVIPRSKVVGTNQVAVYWGLDEVKVLRNLGVKGAPSPIMRSYDWPGQHKPFAHQKETSSFLTLNKNAFVFSEPGCVDADTEYLSPTGWKRIAEYISGDVAQYDPETGRAEFVTPSAFVKLPCAQMVRVKTKYGVDQLLSPEHRMLVRSNAQDKYCVMSAEEMLAAHDDFHAGIRRNNKRKAGSDSISFSHAAIPTIFSTTGGSGLPLSDAELRLQVAVIADGSFDSGTNRCTIRIKKERKVIGLFHLLHAAKVEFKHYVSTRDVDKGFNVFTFKAPLRLKEFDERFWACSTEQLQTIANEVQHWDSCVRGGKRGLSFSTTSKASADFIQYALISCGRTTRITVDARTEKYSSGVCYSVEERGGTRGGRHGLLSLRNRETKTVEPAVSTDGYKYCFTVPTTFLIFRRNGCVFASGNTGKTASALWAADYLMRLGRVRRCLVVCPLSIMKSAWLGDIMKTVIHRSAAVAHHTNVEKRIAIINGSYEFVIINYDALAIVGDAVLKDGRFDLIICDEANAVKNTQTRRWKALAKIARPDCHLWMMTGTPAAQSPLDAFGLARLVNPSGVPKFSTAWRDMVMHKVSMFKWVPKPSAPERVHKALQPAIRFAKADCLDLPPVLTETREVPLTAQQTKYYKALKEHLVMSAAGETITAINAAAAVNKLLQISAGAAYSDDKEVVVFDCSPRMNVLMEVLDQTPRKVLVFAHFRHSIDTIHEAMVKEGIGSAVIHGDISPNERTEKFKLLQADPNLKVLIIQPQAAAHGVTLTAADTVVFWSPVMSVEHYIQCIARADRIGQTSDKVTVVHLQGSEIERRMYRVLEQRLSDHTAIIDLYKEELTAK